MLNKPVNPEGRPEQHLDAAPSLLRSIGTLFAVAAVACAPNLLPRQDDSGSIADSGTQPRRQDASTSSDASRPATVDAGPGACLYEERDGVVVIEAEHLELPEGWNTYADPEASGNAFIQWDDFEQRLNPGMGSLQIPVRIDEPGLYQVEFRSRVGSTTSTTDNNDSWITVSGIAELFAGQDAQLRPEPDCSPCPAPGESADGWFKVFTNRQHWNNDTKVRGTDGHHNVFVEVRRPNTIGLHLAPRSAGHAIDRLTLRRVGISAPPVHAPESRCAGAPPAPDAGSPIVDAGVPIVDAGPPIVDAGTPIVDAGTPIIDAGSPIDGGTGSCFRESGGSLVIQAEDLPFRAPWARESRSDAVGGQYIVWQGPNYFGRPELPGRMRVPICITTPGDYYLRLRSWGHSFTEGNDTWLRFSGAADFFGRRHGSTVHPRPQCEASGGCPEGNSADGFFKAFVNSSAWSTETCTSDFDDHDILVRFAAPGTYFLDLSPRSQGHRIDSVSLERADASTAECAAP